LEFYFLFRCRPFCRNLRVILHQASAFRPNRSTHCGNMTSYPFLKMAAATAQYYFRYRICWSHRLRKVNIYQPTKFRRHISSHGWDITTSVFDKQTSAILEFNFRFRYRHFAIIGELFCIRLPNFIQIGSSTTKIWYHIDFQDGGHQPCCICFGVMADQPRSAFCRLNSILKSLVRRINSSGDRFWRFGLKLPIHATFGGIFPHMTSFIAVTPKRTVLGRKHVVWAIQRKNRCNGSTCSWGAWPRKIQDNKKVIFPLFGGKPPVLDRFDPKVAWWVTSTT